MRKRINQQGSIVPEPHKSAGQQLLFFQLSLAEQKKQSQYRRLALSKGGILLYVHNIHLTYKMSVDGASRRLTMFNRAIHKELGGTTDICPFSCSLFVFLFSLVPLEKSKGQNWKR